MGGIRRHSNGTKMSLCLHFFFRRRFFVGVHLVVVFCALRECTAELTLLPNNPEGVVGEDMRLNCTLTGGKNLTVQSFIFEISDYSTSHGYQISAEYVQYLSNTSAEVTLRNLTDSQHLAVVTCRYGTQFRKAQIITVGRPPAVPIIDYYRYLNWTEFVFRWNINPPNNGFPTQYIAWYKTSRQPDFKPCTCFLEDDSKCPALQVDNRCRIRLTGDLLYEASYDGYLHLKVNSTNHVGSATSEDTKLFYTDFIEPGRLKGVKVSKRFKSDLGRFVDVVSFKPQRAFDPFIVEIRTTSLEDPDDRKRSFHPIRSGEQLNTKKIDLTDLNPYTGYNLSIRSRVDIIGRKSRIWSEWHNVSFTSHEEVPIKSPDVCESCFVVDEGSTHHTVFVYFQSLTKKESRGNVSYDLEYVQLNSGLLLNSTLVDNDGSFQHNQTRLNSSDYSIRERQGKVKWNNGLLFQLKLPKSSKYQLNINARTAAGQSQTKSTTVFIPTQSQLQEKQLAPPTNCSVMSVDGIDDEKRVVFRWNNVTSIEDSAVKTVTVFWCEAYLNSMRCHKPLNWMEVDPSETSVNITLDTSYEKYLFGIGQVSNKSLSRGIHWTCRYYKKDAVASPPHLTQDKVYETSAVMKLEKPNHNPKEGLVYGFNVYYSSVDDKGHQTDLKMFVEDANDQVLVTIKGLMRGTLYTVKAESLTVAGPSYSNVSADIVTLPFRLDGHALGWLIFAAVIVGILALVGFTCCIRWPHEKFKQLRRWWRQCQPCMPDVVLDERDEKQKNPSYQDYYLISDTTASNNALNQVVGQLEDDQEGSERHLDPYSRITPLLLDFNRNTRVSDDMDNMPNIRFCNPVTYPMPERVLPLLVLPPAVPIYQKLSTNLAVMHYQPISSTPVSSDVDQTSLSSGYLPIKTVLDDKQSVQSNELTTPVCQHTLNQTLPTEDMDVVNTVNRGVSNQVLSDPSTNSQPANECLQSHILPSPNELVSPVMTRQIAEATSQEVINSMQLELSENSDENMADRMLPTSSQRMNVNVVDADQSRPTGTDRASRPPARSTFDRQDFDEPSVLTCMLSGQFAFNDNTNSNVQMDPVAEHMVDHVVVPLHQSILPKFLENGRDLNPSAEQNSFAKLQKKPVRTEQKHENGSPSCAERRATDMSAISSIAEVHGRSEQTQRAMRGGSSSPCPSSFSSTGEASSKCEDDSVSTGVKASAPNSLEDDEGIYI